MYIYYYRKKVKFSGSIACLREDTALVLLKLFSNVNG